VIQFVSTVERILYGAYTINEYLESEVERLNGQRVLLLVPRSLKGQSPFQRVSAILGRRLAASFTGAFEHAPLEIIIEADVAARRCDADLVIALGGGSVIDAGKPSAPAWPLILIVRSYLDRSWNAVSRWL